MRSNLHMLKWSHLNYILWRILINIYPLTTVTIKIQSILCWVHTRCVCVCVCVCKLLSCFWLWDPMDCSPPDSSVCGILQARTLEWVAIPFSRGSSQPRDWTRIFSLAGRFFTVWATREAHKTYYLQNPPCTSLKSIPIFVTYTRHTLICFLSLYIVLPFLKIYVNRIMQYVAPWVKLSFLQVYVICSSLLLSSILLYEYHTFIYPFTSRWTFEFLSVFFTIINKVLWIFNLCMDVYFLLGK